MLKFEYNGKSTEDILTTPLAVCEFETQQELPYITRSVLKGALSNHRRANYYDTKEEESLIITCSLVKENGEGFTSSDRNIVESWLKELSLPSKLSMYGKNGEVAYIDGIFTSVSWKRIGSIVAGLDFTFECTTSKYYLEKNITKNVNGTITFALNINTTENKTFPIITIKNLGSASSVATIKTNGDILPIKIGASSTVKINNEFLLIETGQSYESVGFDAIDKINWMELNKGSNEIEVSGGNFTISIEYREYCYGLGSYFEDE